MGSSHKSKGSQEGGARSIHRKENQRKVEMKEKKGRLTERKIKIEQKKRKREERKKEVLVGLAGSPAP